MAGPFVGPGYSLRNRKADVQRSVNLFPSIIESGTGKAPALLQSIPGLSVFADLAGPIRAERVANGRLIVVAGSNVYEAKADRTFVSLGSMKTLTGLVDMAVGVRQVVIVDGRAGYVLNLDTGAFQEITSTGFSPADRVGYTDGYFVFAKKGTRQFFISAAEDALTFDELDFASAESTPENLIGLVIDHRQVALLKTTGIELWDDVGGTDFPFARNNSAVIETGVMAAFTAVSMDNSLLWVGSDKRGAGIVWRLNGFTPTRISNQAVEEAIQSAITMGMDISTAQAFAYQQDGHTFYVLQIPGLTTTWVYDAASGVWHERAEFAAGEYKRHRATAHAHAFGKHLVGADDGKLYEMDPLLNTNAGDVLVRDRISPHAAQATMGFQYFNWFQIDCETGVGKPDGSEALVMMRYSDDGGVEWKNWRTVGLGAAGKRLARAKWLRLGRARDRVWHVRCTDDVPFSIINAVVV